MENNNLAAAEKATKDFFGKIGGKLSFLQCAKTETYSSEDLKIPCVNYYISFNNPDLFGRGDFSQEVYPRYRKMRSDWKSALNKAGIKIYSDLAAGFVPLLGQSAGQGAGFIYPKEEREPLGLEIVDINKVGSPYYGRLAAEYGAKFALREGGGMLVGPEGGMLRVIKTIGDFLGKINSFADIGAGTGELSAFVAKNYQPQNITVNESSPNLEAHLRRYLKEARNWDKTKIDFVFGDCRQMDIPAQADLISVGVFYGYQPSLFEKKGLAIKKSLGENGLLLVQSSMPETLFNQHLLLGDEAGIKYWPWYSEKFNLPYYFNCVESFFIENEFIILASQSKELVRKITGGLKDGIVSYSNFFAGLK